MGWVSLLEDIKETAQDLRRLATESIGVAKKSKRLPEVAAKKSLAPSVIEQCQQVRQENDALNRQISSLKGKFTKIEKRIPKCDILKLLELEKKCSALEVMMRKQSLFFLQKEQEIRDKQSEISSTKQQLEEERREHQKLKRQKRIRVDSELKKLHDEYIRVLQDLELRNQRIRDLERQLSEKDEQELFEPSMAGVKKLKK